MKRFVLWSLAIAFFGIAIARLWVDDASVTAKLGATQGALFFAWLLVGLFTGNSSLRRQ